MPKIKEQEHVRIKEKSTQEGKEQITKVADEKMVTTKAEAEKTEAPKKKKILFACITHRMPVTAAKTDRNVRHQIKNRLQDRSREHRQQNRLRQ